MKKFLALFAAVLVFSLSCFTSFAAGLNSSEQSVLSQMRTPANMNGNSVYVPSSYVNQAESYFNTIDMTSAQASKINGIISQGRSFLEGTGKSSVKELTSAELKTLAGYASSAAAVLNMSAAAGSSSSQVKVIGKNGEVILDESGNIIKTTGAEDQSVPIAVVTFLAVLAVGSGAGIIYLKNKKSI